MFRSTPHQSRTASHQDKGESKSQSVRQGRSSQSLVGFDTEKQSVWKIAFGFIGLFIGPTLLAIGYSLLLDWSRNVQPTPTA